MDALGGRFVARSPATHSIQRAAARAATEPCPGPRSRCSRDTPAGPTSPTGEHSQQRVMGWSHAPPCNSYTPPGLPRTATRGSACLHAPTTRAKPPLGRPALRVSRTGSWSRMALPPHAHAYCTHSTLTRRIGLASGLRRQLLAHGTLFMQDSRGSRNRIFFWGEGARTAEEGPAEL